MIIPSPSLASAASLLLLIAASETACADAFIHSAAFGVSSLSPNSLTCVRPLCMSASENKLTTISDTDDVAHPVAFVFSQTPSSSSDAATENKIMCHIDAVATISDVNYSVGYPCDHAVDIACIDIESGADADSDDEEGGEGLIFIEEDDPLMDQLFPICKTMFEKDKANAKLALFRTPCTLTLAGNLQIDDDEDEDGDDEGVEFAADLLLSFDYDGKEYNLLRPTDLMLLVAKDDPSGNAEQRILISDEESEEIMPALMEMLGL